MDTDSGMKGQPLVGVRRDVRIAGLWYIVVIVGTLGLFAWVPFLHAARRLNNTKAWWLVAIYSGLDVLLYVLAAIAPRSGQAAGSDAVSTIVGLLALGILIVGCVQLWSLRRMVYQGAPINAPDVSSTVDPAIQMIRAARARREEARQLTADDPLLARELHIGRPDLNRDYDDGGLVDLNNAPAQVISRVCDIPLEVADTIVRARTQRGDPFTNVDELLVLTDLPVTTWDRIRDRAVLLP